MGDEGVKGVEMAGLALSITDLAQRRLLDEAARHAELAARVEGAARRQALQIGRLARDGAKLADRRIEPRRRAQQRARIGMLRIVENVAYRRLFDNAPAIHDE